MQLFQAPLFIRIYCTIIDTNILNGAVLGLRTLLVACGKCASPEDVSPVAFANVVAVIHVGPDSRSMCLPALCTQPQLETSRFVAKIQGVHRFSLTFFGKVKRHRNRLTLFNTYASSQCKMTKQKRSTPFFKSNVATIFDKRGKTGTAIFRSLHTSALSAFHQDGCGNIQPVFIICQFA